MSLRIVPVDLRHAQEFVAAHHRHHAAPKGHKISVGIADGETLVGVAILGRPTSRVIQPRGGWNMPSRPREESGPTGIARTLWEAVA